MEMSRIGDYAMHVIGVVKDVLMQSPYEPVKQTMFYLDKGSVVNFKIKPGRNTAEALATIAAVVKKFARYGTSRTYGAKDIDRDGFRVSSIPIGAVAKKWLGIANRNGVVPN